MPTIGELIEKHNELLEYVEAEQAAFDEKIKPYKDAIEAIKVHTGAELMKQVQNIPPWVDTPKANVSIQGVGTAYLQTTLSAKVDNPADFKALCLADWSFADLRCRKDPVREWLIKHNGEKPPGVAVEFITKCNIRRS